MTSPAVASETQTRGRIGSSRDEAACRPGYWCGPLEAGPTCQPRGAFGGGSRELWGSLRELVVVSLADCGRVVSGWSTVVVMEFPWEDALAGRYLLEACPSLFEQLAPEEDVDADVGVVDAVVAADVVDVVVGGGAAAVAIVLAVVPAFGGLDRLCGRRRW